MSAISKISLTKDPDEYFKLSEKFSNSLVANFSIISEMWKQNEREFYSSADYLYTPDVEKNIVLTTAERLKKLKNEQEPWIFAFPGELRFLEAHLEYWKNYLDMREVRKRIAVDCDEEYPSKSERLIFVRETLLSTTEAFMFHLLVTTIFKKQAQTWEEQFQQQDERRRLVQAYITHEDLTVRKVAHTMFDMDQEQKYLNKFRGSTNLVILDHIVEGLSDIIQLTGRKQIASKALPNLIPGMLMLSSKWAERQRDWRVTYHLEDDVKSANVKIDEAFNIGIQQIKSLVENKYFMKQATVLGILSRPKNLNFDGITGMENRWISITELGERYSKLQEGFAAIVSHYFKLHAPAPLPKTTIKLAGAPKKKPQGKKGKPAPKVAPQRKKQIPIPISAPSTSMSAKPSSSTAVEKVAQTSAPQPIHPFIELVLGANDLIYASRVKRWIKCPPNETERVRQFTDKGLRQYMNLSDEAIEEQLRYHGFSPLVDRVLKNEILRNTYTFRTERGRAAIAEMQMEPSKQRQRGVIHWGFIPKTKVCFHRYFTPVSDHVFIRESIKSIAVSMAIKFEDFESELQATAEALEEELAEGFVGDEFEFATPFNLYKVTDKIRNMRICLFPI